eukprot:1196061-Prorocentrum_minimum.AAC.3
METVVRRAIERRWSRVINKTLQKATVTIKRPTSTGGLYSRTFGSGEVSESWFKVSQGIDGVISEVIRASPWIAPDQQWRVPFLCRQSALKASDRSDDLELGDIKIDTGERPGTRFSEFRNKTQQDKPTKPRRNLHVDENYIAKIREQRKKHAMREKIRATTVPGISTQFVLPHLLFSALKRFRASPGSAQPSHFCRSQHDDVIMGIDPFLSIY